MLNSCKEINRFYRSSEWAMARAEKIEEAHGLCEICGAVGEEVHHIIHLTPENIHNPEITLGKKNLILLCKDCPTNSMKDSTKLRGSLIVMET